MLRRMGAQAWELVDAVRRGRWVEKEEKSGVRVSRSMPTLAVTSQAFQLERAGAIVAAFHAAKSLT